MSITTEREIKVANGLGDADASQVLAGATFSSEEGFNIEGTFVPSAVNIAYDNTTSGMASTNVQGAIDEISETASNLPSAGTKITGVLTAGQTTVTLTSEEITSDTKLNAVYTSIYGVSLRSATFGEGTLTLEFPMQEEDMTVMALIDASVSSGSNENDGTMTANKVTYDNSTSGMYATNVQDAIDEVNTLVASNTEHTKNTNIHVSAEEKDKWNNLGDNIGIPANSAYNSYKVKELELDFSRSMSILGNDFPMNFSWCPAVVLNDEIYLVGGGTGSTNGYTYFYKFDGVNWSKLSDLPYLGLCSSAVVLNGEIHILGGSNGTTNHYKYNPTNNEWKQESTLPYEFNYSSAVVLNGEIHILGGNYSGTSTNHYKYNGSAWERVSSLPYTFAAGSAVVLDGEIHLLGSGASGGNRKHYKYNGSAWENVSTLPFDFQNSSAVVYNGEIHLLGSGVSGYGTNHYKFNGSTWERVSILPYSFYNGQAVVLNEKICLLGGTSNSTKFYMYDNEKWAAVKGIPYNFRQGSVVVLNDEIHILGGNTTDTYKKHYKLDGILWKQVSTLPFNYLGDTRAVVLNGEIHLLGSNYDGYHTKHYKFNGTSWEEVSTLPYDFAYGCAVVLNGEIHILGGNMNSTTFTNHYKFNGTDWESVSTLPYNFAYGCAVVLNGEIHILGGASSPYYYYHYKFNGTTWKSVSTLPYYFRYGSAFTLENKIHILGTAETTNSYYYCYYIFDGANWIPNQIHIAKNIKVSYNQSISLNGDVYIIAPNDNQPTLTYVYKKDINKTWIKNILVEDSNNNVSKLSFNSMGINNIISNANAYAFGNDLTSYNNQMVIGHKNNLSKMTDANSLGTTGSAFVIGNGTASTVANAFRVDYDGKAYGLSSFNTSGADYSEFFEWLDGNENNEDRIGYFVTLNGDKITLANKNDYILGITSGNPCIIGNSDECWRGRYLLDEYDRFIEETFEYTELNVNKGTGKEEIITKIGTRYKENPDYNPNQDYIQRQNRKEWSTVGLIGVLPVRDDGTCQVNGYCTVADGGIATACEYGINTYRVLERVADNVVKVLFK